MPRQVKWVAAGIYQPTATARRAYGPRRWGRCELLEEFLRTPCDVLDAATVARYGGAQGLGGQAAECVAVKMPRGGVRWLLICPRCKAKVTRLYGRYHPAYRRLMHACRACWGLRYQSQYAGRRLEAHPSYLQAATQRQIARTPRDVSANPDAPRRRQRAMSAHHRRMRRYAQAQALLCERTDRDEARREIAHNLALYILLARSEAEERHRWQRLLRQVLWHGDLPTMRQIAEGRDTPQWAREALQSAIERAESGQKPARTSLKQALERLDSDEKAQFAALIDQARLDHLRAEYAALSQARRAKRAA